MDKKGECPHCKEEFEVSQYGFKLPCPCCGKRINIFPDPQFFIFIKNETIGVAVVDLDISGIERLFKKIFKLLF